MKHIGEYIIQLGRLQQIYLDRVLERYNLSGNRYLYLLKTCESQMTTSGQIAKELQIRSSSVLEIIKILESFDYINAVQPYNKVTMGRGKSVYIEPTKKAIKVQPNIIKILNDWDDMVLKSLSNKEQYIVTNLIIAYSERLKKDKTKDTLRIDESVLAILPTLSRVQQQILSVKYKKYPLIKGSKILCLFEMYERNEFTLKDISESTMLAHSNLCGIFRQYEKQGYIKRNSKLNKLKSSDVFYITDKAIDVYTEIDSYFKQNDLEVLQDLNEEYNDIISLLEKLERSMIKYLDENYSDGIR